MNPCERCHAGCCRAFAIPVTGADVLRLMRSRGLSFWDVACRWEDPDGLIARRTAPHFYFADAPETPFTLCLLHEPSRLFPGTTKCRFLTEHPPSPEHPDGRSECSVYADRPGTCRAFPVTLSMQGGLAFPEVPEYGREEHHPAYKLCPRPWTTADLNASATLHSLHDTVAEMRFLHLVAQSWNRRASEWELFPEFLQTVYQRREEHEQNRQRRAA
jgi:Fe-S-cluster containining protein